MANTVKLAPHAMIILVGVMLGAGVVLGYAIHSSMDKPVSVPDDAVNVPEAKLQPTVVLPSAGEAVAAADLESMQARIRELESLLEERESRLERMQAEGRERRGRRGDDFTNAVANAAENIREGFRERMERFKTENPEQYAEMQRGINEFRERMHTDNQNRYTFFESIDTGKMTAEQKKNHDSLLNAIAVRDAYMDRMGPDSENPLSDDERREFFESMRSIGGLMEQERRYILEEAGRVYGEDGAVFADYIQQVYENTSMGFRGMGGMRPPEGGPNGGPNGRGGRGGRGDRGGRGGRGGNNGAMQ